jgi:hypothetical protein
MELKPMRPLLIVGLFLTLSATALAQGTAAERAATVRQQILENDEKQAALKTRLQELDEAMKPENIEKSLAGVGSTKPEELREQKRKQFEIERKGVQSQLDLLVTGRTRLETSLARAEADAYRESAGVGPTGNVVTPTPATPSVKPATTTTPAPAVRRTRRTRRPRARPRRTTSSVDRPTDRTALPSPLRKASGFPVRAPQVSGGYAAEA